ncbi:hypothetical protein O6H91_10G052000 [Diphasiastrum complanatum]|uniref:Uncharacterized protein n=2 Tax=Diphasiastrum complanatum TaxID=34168 RepID=A0ACC2CGX0_DIPCM|nr:hypothetical protein O6H91_10G052000 [Diphasiastrum complanatum]
MMLLLVRRLISSSSMHKPNPHLSKIILPSPHKVEVEFDNGRKFQFSSEFLRVQSLAADSKNRTKFGQPTVISGRRHVGIMSLEFVGNYAVRIMFDDLHNTGIYTWDYLYHLGENKFSLMRNYIKFLRQKGLSRDPISKR